MKTRPPYTHRGFPCTITRCQHTPRHEPECKRTYLVRDVDSSLSCIQQERVRTTRMPAQHRSHVINLVVKDDPRVVLVD